MHWAKLFHFLKGTFFIISNYIFFVLIYSKQLIDDLILNSIIELNDWVRRNVDIETSDTV